VRKALLVGLALAIALAAAATWLLHPRPQPPRLERPGCQTGPTTPGIDVSYHQETIDWPRVQRAGIRFAFIRLSDGATLRDAMFATNWAEAKRAGLVRGAYQFFRPDQGIAAQADLMIAAMRDRDLDDLPPALDIEVDGGFEPLTVAERARAWIQRVRDKLGVEPLGAQALWIAHYTQGCPMLPAPWTRWTFWQHTDRGAVPGIEGPVDLDLFAGTLGELHAAR